MIISEPDTLKRCDNPAIRAKSNAITGTPDDWFSASNLAQINRKRLHFDFFVNWKTYQLDRDIWFKRTLSVPVDNLELQDIAATLIAYETRDGMETLCQFCQKYDLKAHFVIFNDADWHEDKPLIMLSIDYYDASTGNFQLSFNKINVSAFRNIIAQKTGERFHMGKPLTFSTSFLECYLSRTDTPYPGDVDAIIIDENYQAKFILEYKKHNLNTPINEQRLGNYYPKQDKRKYDRLNILANYLDAKLSTLYYTTDARKETKIELNNKGKSELNIWGSKCLPSPDNKNNAQQVQEYITNVNALHR